MSLGPKVLERLVGFPALLDSLGFMRERWVSSFPVHRGAGLL